jgi:hypothetical protein
MNILDRLLGRQKRTSITITREIDAQIAGLEDARKRVQDAKAARQAALDAFDNGALKSAADAQAEAERDVELREYAITQLRAAHVEQVDVEDREEFR